MQKEIIFNNAHLFIGVSKRQFNDFIKRAKKIRFGMFERAFKIEELNYFQLKLDIHASYFRFSFEDKEITFHNYKEYFYYNNPVKFRKKIKIER